MSCSLDPRAESFAEIDICTNARLIEASLIGMNVTGVFQNRVSAFVWNGWHIASSLSALMHMLSLLMHACM